MARRYIVREEPFGVTLYDRKKMHYQFYKAEDVLSTLKKLQIDDEGIELWYMQEVPTRKDVPYAPIRVYYELTLSCNLRCKLCYNNSGKARATELSTEEVLSSLANLRQANVIDIRFSGGELTQRPDWYEIFSVARELGFVISCNTNGVYQDSTIVEKFLDLELDQITLSIDGLKEAHDIHRGKGTFERTLDVLRLLQEGGANLRINTLLTSWSEHDIEEMIALASKYALEINLFSPRFTGRAALHLDKAFSFDEHYHRSMQVLELQNKYPGVRIIGFEGSMVENSTNSSYHKSLGLMEGGPDGFTRFNIISDGSLFAGGYMAYIDPTRCLGNIKTDDIFNIWQNSSKLYQIRLESQHLKLLCACCPELGNRCAGGIYEMEVYRQVGKERINPFCVFTHGPSLLDLPSLPSMSQ